MMADIHTRPVHLPSAVERPKVCFVSTTRYGRPLDQTADRKFNVLSEIADVYVISFSQGVRFQSWRQHARFYLIPSPPRFPLLRYGLMFVAGIVLLAWCLFRHRIQIVVAQGPYEAVIAASLKGVCRLINRPFALVVENHGDFEESLFMERKLRMPKAYRFVMRRLARFSLKRGDGFRAVSSSTHEQLREWGVSKPISQFPTWTDIDVFISAGEAMDHVTNDILFAGVVIPRKGLHDLLEAFAEASSTTDAYLVVVGPTPNTEYEQIVRKLVDDLGISDRVSFEGSLSQGALASRMQQARVFVLPSYSEGLPRVVFEAMAVGRPVIATRVSGIPDVIEDGKTGYLVSPGDSVALAERIKYVFEHPEAAEKVGEAARDKARSIFAPTRYTNSYRKLFEAVQNSESKQ